jgi:hypothetical protein
VQEEVNTKQQARPSWEITLIKTREIGLDLNEDNILTTKRTRLVRKQVYLTSL